MQQQQQQDDDVPIEEEAKAVVERLQNTKQQVTALAQKLGVAKEPRLVAVSKTKPKEFITACHAAGHLHFGENYVQELVDKAALLPTTIQWHFIGHLQSNKAKILTSVASLSCVETVHSLSIAKALDKAWAARQATMPSPPLRVMVQVHTSGEESKSGVDPDECVELVSKVLSDCKQLQFAGLMTIGKLDGPPQDDFQKLADCREMVCKTLGLNKDDVELSMGMSHDWQTAVEYGSTNVRVGSSIFGARVYNTAT